MRKHISCIFFNDILTKNMMGFKYKRKNVTKVTIIFNTLNESKGLHFFQLIYKSNSKVFIVLIKKLKFILKIDFF